MPLNCCNNSSILLESGQVEPISSPYTRANLPPHSQTNSPIQADIVL